MSEVNADASSLEHMPMPRDISRREMDAMFTEANMLDVLARIERGDFPMLRKLFPSLFGMLERAKRAPHEMSKEEEVEAADTAKSIMDLLRQHLADIAHNHYEAAVYLGEKFSRDADMHGVLTAHMAEIDVDKPGSALPILREGVRLGFIDNNIAAQIIALARPSRTLFLEIVLGISSLNAYLSDFQAKITQ